MIPPESVAVSEGERAREAVAGFMPREMRAAVVDQYGCAENLRTATLRTPRIGDEQVLIRVAAAGVNPVDWKIRAGMLRRIRPASFPLVLGFDIAGEVVQVGPMAAEQGWKIGDEVVAFLDSPLGGGYAEFAAVGAGVVARRPRGTSVDQAAAIPLAATTAWQSLHRIAEVRTGQRVLVNGASGGVGTFAVQIARAAGTVVTGVCSDRNAEMVAALGVERVIDYERHDFTGDDVQYDVIFDAVANRTYRECRRVLSPHGVYITTLPSLQTLVYSALTAFSSRRCRLVMAKPNGEDLSAIVRLVESGEIVPVVDRMYPLAEVAAAHRYSETGRAHGKIVLVVGD
jgi:NADPH:quinone reductase-like Zn-dependent oxidoreductase